MTIIPLRDSVVVVKNEDTQTSPGGIFIAVMEPKNVTGKVVAVGAGRTTLDGHTVPLEVVVGDQVVFNKNYAVEVTDSDVTYLVLKEDNVICILR